MPAKAGIHDLTRQEKQASGSFLKKRTKKLLLLGAAGWAIALPAYAQTTPNASNDCGIITLPKAPGDAPGGNVFSPALGGPQPADLPNNETATFPDITPLTPDRITPSAITPDLAPNQPFPFSHIIADPVLAHGFGPETAAPPPKKAC
jgi:hypothetical protein